MKRELADNFLVKQIIFAKPGEVEKIENET